MAHMLTRAGDIVPLESEKVLFRKYFMEGVQDIEHEIVGIIRANPHPHIVAIYDVTDEYYDMELVKTGLTSVPVEDRECMRELKRHLQSLGIAYLDWKIDNFGLDENGTLKMFDFNACGLFETKSSCCGHKSVWKRPPDFDGYLLRRSREQGHKKTPTECDDWIFETQFIACSTPP